MEDDVKQVLKNIDNIYKRYRIAVKEIAKHYALKAKADFVKEQGEEKYWENQTNQAMDRMFTKAFVELSIVGWFMAHGVEYGPYLELANNGQNQSIRPTMAKFAAPFLKDVQEIFR